jgi:plastocyanin
MHAIAVHLAPVLGAEKSKVPFYVAGGLLVAWALFVSLGVGARRSDFPAGISQQRAVIALTAVLVLAAVSTAVITSGAATKSEASTATPAQSTAGATSTPAGVPAETQATTTTSPKATTTTSPKATTGTPAPASSPAARAGATLKLAADPSALAYDTKQLSTKAGPVKIDFTNASPLEHDVTIAQGSKVLGATPVFMGGSKSLTLSLAPGKYTFYCSVPGHRQAGMEGTLTVS